MTSRERVRRTLEFDNPDRIPRHLWTLPWADINHPAELAALQRDFPDDIVHAPANYSKPLPGRGDLYAAGEAVDEWGCVFTNIHPGIVGEVKEPLIRDWNRVDELRPPVELLDFDVDEVNAFCRSTDRFVIGKGLARPFERMQWLRTTEQFFMDLALNPADVNRLGRRVHQFYLDEMEAWCRAEVDAVWFMNDWGSQHSLLISPTLWEEMFLPYYRDYISLAHRYGKKVFFHSDGHIRDIYEPLINLGLDAINSQVFCMDPDELGSSLKGRITFWGELDRQHLLPEGTPEDIDRAAALLRTSFWSDGGFITQCEFGPGAKPENIRRYFAALS